MFKCSCLVLSSVLLVCGISSAKPKSVRPDLELDSCAWAAEVQVLQVNAGIPIHNQEQTATVRVTDDPERIFRGFELLGDEVTIHLNLGGEISCGEHLRRLAKEGGFVLMVVRGPSEVVLVGEPIDDEPEPTYRLQAWYDFNACFLIPQNETFGNRVPGEGGFLGRETLNVQVVEVAGRFTRERSGFFREAARILVAPPPKMSAEEFAEVVEQFGSRRFAVRQAAFERLVAAGPVMLPQIEAVLPDVVDPEVQRRLSNAKELLEEDAAAWRYVDCVRSGDRLDEVKALRAVLPWIEEEMIRERVENRLEELAVE